MATEHEWHMYVLSEALLHILASHLTLYYVFPRHNILLVADEVQTVSIGLDCWVSFHCPHDLCMTLFVLLRLVLLVLLMVW